MKTTLRERFFGDKRDFFEMRGTETKRSSTVRRKRVKHSKTTNVIIAPFELEILKTKKKLEKKRVYRYCE